MVSAERKSTLYIEETYIEDIEETDGFLPSVFL